MEIHAKKETTDMDEVFKEIRKRKHQWKEKASFSGRVLSEEGDSQ